MTLRRLTYSRMTLNRMTFRRLTLKRMPSRFTLNRMMHIDFKQNYIEENGSNQNDIFEML